METQKLQFLYWLEEILYGKQTKHWIVQDCVEGVSDLETADEWLQKNMADLMATNDWDLVLDYQVTEIGYSLLTPAQKKTYEAYKAKELKKAQKQQDIANALLEEQKTKEQKLQENLEKSSFNMPVEDRTWNYKINFEGFESKSEALKEIFKDKSILFLENDGCLSYNIGYFYKWIEKEGIKSDAIFHLRNLDMDFIASQIMNHDIIIYQSQYVYETTFTLVDFVKKLPTKKTIIEVCIKEPHFYYLPDGVIHDMYAIETHEGKAQEWEIYKILKETPYWENEIK